MKIIYKWSATHLLQLLVLLAHMSQQLGGLQQLTAFGSTGKIWRFICKINTKVITYLIEYKKNIQVFCRYSTLGRWHPHPHFPTQHIITLVWYRGSKRHWQQRRHFEYHQRQRWSNFTWAATCIMWRVTFYRQWQQLANVTSSWSTLANVGHSIVPAKTISRKTKIRCIFICAM